MKKRWQLFIICSLWAVGSIPAFGQGALGDALVKAVFSQGAVKQIPTATTTQQAFRSLVRTWERGHSRWAAGFVARKYLDQPTKKAVFVDPLWYKAAYEAKITGLPSMARAQALAISQGKKALDRSFSPADVSSFYLSLFPQTLIEEGAAPTMEQFDKALLFYYKESEKLIQQTSFTQEDWALGVSLINNIGLFGSLLDGELIVQIANLPFAENLLPWTEYTAALALLNLGRYELLEEFIVVRLERDLLQEGDSALAATFANIKALVDEKNIPVYIPQLEEYKGAVTPLPIELQRQLARVSPYNLLQGTLDADRQWIALRRALEKDFRDFYVTQRELRRVRYSLHQEQLERIRQQTREPVSPPNWKQTVRDGVRTLVYGIEPEELPPPTYSLLLFQLARETAAAERVHDPALIGPNNLEDPASWNPATQRYEYPSGMGGPWAQIPMEPKYFPFSQFQQEPFNNLGISREELERLLGIDDSVSDVRLLLEVARNHLKTGLRNLTRSKKK